MSSELLANSGSILLYILIVVSLIDIFFLIRKNNNVYISFINTSITIILFILLEYAFLTDKFDIVYVWQYSSKTLDFVYKSVAIWAGQEGSILTWMVFNALIISFYRMKNTDKEDKLFLISSLVSSILSLCFVFILISMEPFEYEIPYINLNGNGLNSLLHSPFMIWHPFFIFISYAIFVIPFIVEIAKIIKPDLRFNNTYQKNYYNFTLRIGWLILTIGIALGSYWAKVTQNWGNYFWTWDPVETASLIPWFFSTSIFHTNIFNKKDSSIKKMNMISIFLSIIFATLITRGGGFTSLHAFTGALNLIIYATISGAIPLILTLIVMYKLIDIISEDYKNPQRLFDYLSYFFLYFLAFICIFGLIIPPFTYILSESFGTSIINIDMGYYMTACLIAAIGLAISMVYCSLLNILSIKKITIFIIVCVVIHAILSIVINLLFDFWINPICGIYYAAFIAALINILKNLNFEKGISRYFKKNAKIIIHMGMSIVLIGTLVGENLYRTILYFMGFSVMIFGIIPAIIVSFIISRRNMKIQQNENT